VAVSVAGACSATTTATRAQEGATTPATTSSRTGTPIVAPVAGTVTFRDVSLGGRSFFLEGVDGNEYFGTHLRDTPAAPAL
jgi:hypothetical protein